MFKSIFFILSTFQRLYSPKNIQIMVLGIIFIIIIKNIKFAILVNTNLL